MSTSVNSYNTDDLIADIKTVGHVPVGNSTFTNQKLLDLANNELQTALLKQMISVREGYFLKYTDYAPTSDGIYDLPSDAIGEKISLVQIVASTALIPVSRVEISEALSTEVSSSGGFGFYIQDNSIHLTPFRSLPGNLRVYYYRRPSKAVLVTSCAKVVSVSTNAVTVSSVPTGWVAGDTVDLQQGLPNFKLYTTGIAITDVTGSVITLASGGSNLVVNDFLTPINQSCVLQIPVEFRPLLVQRVVCKIYEIQNYSSKLARAQAALKEMTDNVMELISPRIENEAKVITTSQSIVTRRRRSQIPAV